MEFALTSDATDDDIIQAARMEGIPSMNGSLVRLLAIGPDSPDMAEVTFSTAGHKVRRFIEFPNLRVR